MTCDFRSNQGLQFEVTVEGLVTQKKVNDDKTLLAEALAEYNLNRTGT